MAGVSIKPEPIYVTSSDVVGLYDPDNDLMSGGGTPAFSQTLCSYYMDGSAHRILLPSTLKTITLDPVTYPDIVYRYVVRVDSLVTNSTLFSVWNTAGNNRSLWHRINSDGSISLIGSINGTSSWQYDTAIGVITSGWYDIVLSQHFGDTSGSRFDCYVNGVSETFTLAGTDSSYYSASTADLHFGYVEPSSNYMDGYVNAMSVWLDTTDLTEVQSLYNSGSPRLTRDIILTTEADYIFDNDTFAIPIAGEWAVIDDSGNGHDGQTENMDAVDRDCNENPY